MGSLLGAPVEQDGLAHDRGVIGAGVGHGRQKGLPGGALQTGSGAWIYRNVFDFRRPVMYHQPGKLGDDVTSIGRLASDHGSPAWEPMFIYHNTIVADDRDEEAVEAASRRVGEKLAILNRQLTQRPYILGEQLTIADIAIGVQMYRYFNLPIERPPLANVEVWYKRLTQRPAYQTHVMVDFKPMMVPGA